MRLVPESALSELLRGLTRAQARQLLDGLSESLTTYSQQTADPDADGPIHQPLRAVFTTSEGNARIFMPAADAHTTSIKVVTVPKQGDIKGTISLYNQDGSLKGLLSAAEITAFRTALASMTLLARATGMSKREIAIFGAGKQAEWHARLAALLFGEDIARITFINRSSARMAEVCRSLAADLKQYWPDLKIEQLAREGASDEEYATALRRVVSGAGVIHCCTPSTQPLFSRADLGDEPKFLSMIGSYKPHMQEIDAETLLSGNGRVFVDSKHACLEEAGEIIMAKLDESHLIELGTFFADAQSTAAASKGSNVVFKCVGMGIMDLAVAQNLLDIAVAENIGQDIDGF